jgi:putative Holliday junction resolvase
VATLLRVAGARGPDAADTRAIAAEVAERQAAVVYIGLPRHLSGSEGESTADARGFAARLAAAVSPVPVRLVDERMSTLSAAGMLREAGKATRSHRSVIDQAAAVVILQFALDTERASGARAGEDLT